MTPTQPPVRQIPKPPARQLSQKQAFRKIKKFLEDEYEAWNEVVYDENMKAINPSFELWVAPQLFRFMEELIPQVKR